LTAFAKAVVEGKFGLFAQELGPVVAVVDTSATERLALTVSEAVTRAYAAGRNHRPRRKDGKTPYELYRDRNRSPEAIAAAVNTLRAIKDRVDQRAAREAAGRDPRVLAAFFDGRVAGIHCGAGSGARGRSAARRWSGRIADSASARGSPSPAWGGSAAP
jgi:hypothetical protein